MSRIALPTLTSIFLLAGLVFTLLPLLATIRVPILTVRLPSNSPTGRIASSALGPLSSQPLMTVGLPHLVEPPHEVYSTLFDGDVDRANTKRSSSRQIKERAGRDPSSSSVDISDEELEQSEEYRALRKAGLTPRLALERSRIAWVAHQARNEDDVGGRIVRIGAMNACVEVEGMNACMLLTTYNDGESIIDYPLATFPWRTPAAILLAISLISQIILTLIHTFSVVPILGFLKNRLRGLTYRDRRAASIDTQSVHQLVTHPSGPVSTSSERQGRCLYAFIAFWIISLAFATAGAAMLLDASIKVEKRGDGDADLGPSAYLLGALPFVLLFTAAFHLVPRALRARRGQRQTHDESVVEEKQASEAPPAYQAEQARV